MEQLKEGKYYMAIPQFFAAIILSVILLPLGFIYSLFLPFKRKYGPKYFVSYLYRFLVQIWRVVMYMLNRIAYSIDLLGNVIVGELLEDLITDEEYTWFGNYRHSISQSIGKLEFEKKLNKRGQWLQKTIDKIFGKYHCLNAYWTNRKNK